MSWHRSTVMKLILATLASKLAAYAAVTYGAWLAWAPAGWMVGGALLWWLLKEEIEPWVASRITEDKS